MDKLGAYTFGPVMPISISRITWLLCSLPKLMELPGALGGGGGEGRPLGLVIGAEETPAVFCKQKSTAAGHQ